MEPINLDPLLANVPRLAEDCSSAGYRCTITLTPPDDQLLLGLFMHAHRDGLPVVLTPDASWKSPPKPITGYVQNITLGPSDGTDAPVRVEFLIVPR